MASPPAPVAAPCSSLSTGRSGMRLAPIPLRRVGNSDRATSVIGRAVVLINILGCAPGGIDRSTLATLANSPIAWPRTRKTRPGQPLSVLRGMPAGASAVTVMAAIGAAQVMNESAMARDPGDVCRRDACQPVATTRSTEATMPSSSPNSCASYPGRRAGPRGASPNSCSSGRGSIGRGEWADVGKSAVVRGPRRHGSTPH